MIWLFVFFGIGVWVAYLACGLLIARVLAAGSKVVRTFYWVLPIIVGIFGAGTFSAVAKYSKVGLGIGVWLSVAAVLALFGYFYQWMVQIYIFRCSTCGITRITYRTAWRRGIYTCPNCKRQYFKGVMGPG